MLAGRVKPPPGRTSLEGSVSGPFGLAGSLHRDLTGAQNTRFIARAYGVDTDELITFVEHFAELESHFHLPVRNYSAGMKARLAFGISIGIPFDTYLVDEVTAVGDAAFKRKSRLIFRERLRNAGAVVVTHSAMQVRNLCDAGAVLENGKLHYYDDVEAALDHHHRNIGSNEDE